MFTLIVPPFGEYPSLTLSPWMYGRQFTFFRYIYNGTGLVLSNVKLPEKLKTAFLMSVSSNEEMQSPDMRYFGEVLLNRPGFGTRCMVDEPLKYVYVIWINMQRILCCLL